MIRAMSLIYEILKEIAAKNIYYKGARVNLYGIPLFKSYSHSSLSGTLSQLRKNDLVENSTEGLRLTIKGKKYIQKKMDSFKQFYFKFDKNSPKNLIVMFDISETKKAEREWLRWHLKKFNYHMIQKSVWVGPSPLPKDFLDYLEHIKIKDGVKTFKLAKGYSQ